jgi:putative membrane protein
METAMKKTFAPILIALLAAGLLPAAHAANPSDAQIAAIVVAANTVDIDAGKLAESKTKNKDVRAFAERMVADHSGVNQQAVALVTKLHVTPEENDTSKSLTQGGAATRDKLKGLSGSAFDKAYVDNEVSYHQTVLDALDKTLIPSASNAELKALLTKVRPAFVAHLEHAKHMQANMK